MNNNISALVPQIIVLLASNSSEGWEYKLQHLRNIMEVGDTLLKIYVPAVLIN